MSYMLMGATDVVVAGRASANDLAGLALGTAFGNAIWFFVSGVIFSVTPIIAQLYGAKKFIEIGKKLRDTLDSFFSKYFYCLNIYKSRFNIRPTSN